MSRSDSLGLNLGVFGWNFSFIGDINLSTDIEGNVYISNLGLESIFSQKLVSEEPSSSTYSLSSQQLLQPYSSYQRIFKPQADGSYEGDGGTLTWNVDHYELEANGNKIVFRADGRLNYVEYSNGYRLSAGYNNDLLTELSDSNGDSFTIGYNSDGRIETISDDGGQVNTYSYDATGQYLLSVEDVNGTTSFSYDNPFDPTAVSSITYSDGSKVSYDYDHIGRLQQVIYGEGRDALAYTYSYDDNGGVTVINPNGATNQEIRNEQGQVSQTIDTNGRVTNYSYDEAGNLVGIDGELGFSASFTYDEAGNIISQTNALNQTIHFTYDADSNNLSGFRDARGNDVLYSYDSRGNLTNIIYEDGTTDKYVYNADGLLTKSINRRGQEIAYEYNNNYQITKETRSDGSIIEYEYGADSGLLTYTWNNNSGKTTQFNYNQAEKRLTIGNSNGHGLSYTFDKLGRKAQIAIQDGINTYITNYSYDSLGRLDRLTDGNGSLIVDYDYHSVSGQLVKETNGNGTYTSYSYDLAGQLVSLVNAKADGTVNSRFDYTYDNLGRRTEVATLDGTWSYEYDLTGQLTGAVFTSTNPDIESQDLTYVYDAAGNRTQTIVNGVTENYSANNLNQYQSAGTTTYSYDLDGNLTSKTEGGQTWTYSYDDNNRLVEVIDSNDNLTQYEYDAFGNRTATVYNGQRTEYLIDPFGYGNVIAEYDGDGNLIAKYEHGIGLVSRTDAGNNQSFYDFDGTGSTAALTGQGGTELNSYNYRPFGEDFYEVETVDNSFEYIGQWGITEEVNGLDFMRARYYDSHSGRFVASDPIGLQGQDTNFYRYVNNDPIGYVDPEGTILLTIAAVTTLAIVGGGAVGTGVGFAVGKFGNETVTELAGAAGLAISLAGLSIPDPTVSKGLAAFGLGLSYGTGVGSRSNPNVFETPPAVAAEPPVTPPPYTEEVEDGFEEAEDQVQLTYYDPLIMDLDGDGVELTSLENSKVYFDIDGDGFREKTGWLKSDDGLLVLDRNNDGYINDISELFGNQTISGFTELQELDSNNDGQITAADTNFTDLQVWRDLDEDGRSDVNELYSLAELNINRIDAVGNPVNITSEGHLINETGSFELADGTQREVVNVWMSLDQQDSYYDHKSTFNTPVVITEQILNLPNLKGYGNLPDLRIAIAKDSELLALVESFTDSANSGDISAARELMRPILLLWAGVDGVDSSSNSSTFAQELEFLEKFVGRSWNNTNPSGAGIQTIRNTFTQLESELETRLLVQVIESSVGYNTTAERYEFSGDIQEAVEQFKQVVTGSQTDSSETLDLEALALTEFIQQSVSSSNWLFSVSATNEDVTLEILATDLVGADSGLDTSNLSFSSINDAVNGTAIVNTDGNIEFIPAVDFNGIALVEYTITDGTKALTGLARVNVAPVNDAPVANNDTATTEEDTPLTILAADLLGNDSDVDRDTLSISSVNNALGGTAIVKADGNVEFTPDANFNGTASFDYTVSDGKSTDTASIEITVNSVNDAPLANNDTAAAIDEDTSITILATELLGNDSDVEGDSLNITSVNSDSGTATLNAEGQIEFTPNANFNGIATFNYTVSDGTNSSTASVELVINPVNDVLIANSDTFTTDEDTPITISASELFANDVNDDIEKSLVVSQISNSTNGTAVIDEDGNVQFTPDANFKGIASFDYTVTDGTDSETASVEVVVNSVNDAPIANSDTATTDEDTPIVILATELLGNDINLDPEDSLSLVAVNNAVGGTVVINAEGNVEFTPDTNFNGTASFDYTVSDGTVNDTASVEVTVNAVNDAPILTAPIPNITLPKNAEDSVIDLTKYFEDVENGDNLAYQLNSTVSSFQTNTGSYKFFDVFSIDNTKTLTLGYADNVAGTATITVEVTDSANESVETSFNVSVVNSVPVANNDTATTEEDTTITISATELLGNDRDDDAVDSLSIKRISNSANGTAVINQDGNIEFTPAANFNGIATFEYVVTDGMDDATGSVQVEVNPVNDAPIAVEDTFTTEEDTSITILVSDLLGNDRDLEGDSFSFSGINSSFGGTAVLNAEGNIEFTPDADFNGTASFEYSVTDGMRTTIGLARVDVSPVNDAPILTETIPNITVAKNAQDSVIVLADYFEDVENGDNLAYSYQYSSSFQGGTSGKFFDRFLFDSSAKALILDYANDVIGTSTIIVTATDSSNESVQTSFTVSVVDSVNDIKLNNDTVIRGKTSEAVTRGNLA